MPYLPRHLHEAIRTVAQKYAWPGGYPLYAVMADGESLCPDCLNENLKLIVQATHDYTKGHFRDDWAIQGAEINWEDPLNYCCNCNSRIPSAYAEDDVDEPEDWAQERLKAIAMPLPEDDQP